MSALELAARVRAGEVSWRELADACLEGAHADPCNAFTYVADEPRPPVEGAPFTGVPIAIKDLNDVAGMPTTYSCRAYARNVAAADAAVTRRIRDAGFVIVGKTNTPEFGTIAQTESELNGACLNPWDTTRTPGGSSGGAAAAVASGVLTVAHASDGGGSIRVPASCCGLVGIKPSRGRVSPAPYVSGSLGLGTSGPIARTVRDAAALLDAMRGNEPGDMYVAPEPERPYLEECEREPGRLRVAVTTAPPADVPVEPECAAAAHDAAGLLAELGHDVVEATPPWQAGELLLDFIRVWQVGPATAGVEDLSLLEPLNRALAEQARATPSPEYVAAVTALQTVVRQVVAFWADVDVVVTPTLAQLPVPIGWTWEDTDGDPLAAFARQTLFTPFTPLVNVTGQPALSLPLAWSASGLPVGVQFVGRPFDEATLVRLAAQLEAARPWAGRFPPAPVGNS
ncbi:MAG TPA: amidase [Gaiellaceae bacterium]|nr:amidase [Gaiellaceae bacterium]